MRPIDYRALTHKTCSSCKRNLPVACFNREVDTTAKVHGWRYRSRCRECNKADCRRYGTTNRDRRNARLRAWRKKNPEKAKENDTRGRLRKSYGLTADQVELMRRSQDGKCAICRKNTKLFIDHCHRTGKIRELLCNRCNLILGIIETNKDRLTTFNDYIAKHEGSPCHADILLELANQ